MSQADLEAMWGFSVAPAPSPTPPTKLSGVVPPVFIQLINQTGKPVYWFIADGPNSYWRAVPAGQVRHPARLDHARPERELVTMWRSAPTPAPPPNLLQPHGAQAWAVGIFSFVFVVCMALVITERALWCGAPAPPARTRSTKHGDGCNRSGPSGRLRASYSGAGNQRQLVRCQVPGTWGLPVVGHGQGNARLIRAPPEPGRLAAPPPVAGWRCPPSLR